MPLGEGGEGGSFSINKLLITSYKQAWSARLVLVMRGRCVVDFGWDLAPGRRTRGVSYIY